jgi:hypothetical protein
MKFKWSKSLSQTKRKKNQKDPLDKIRHFFQRIPINLKIKLLLIPILMKLMRIHLKNKIYMNVKNSKLFQK